MTHQEFEKLRDEVPTSELIKKAKNVLNGLCSNNQTFIMTVPPRLDDSDIILSDVIKRLEHLSQQSKTQQP